MSLWGTPLEFLVPAFSAFLIHACGLKHFDPQEMEYAFIGARDVRAK